MRFSSSRLPAEFEIPDEWLAEAGMTGFRPSTPAYISADPGARAIPLRDIEPPFRSPVRPLDFCGFNRARMVRLLSGFVTGSDIPAVPLMELPRSEFPKAAFGYRVKDGYHHFYASVASGFECLPGKLS